MNAHGNIIQDKMFSENFLIALIEELSCIGAGFIDGAIISIFLGSTAMAAEGLVHPFFSLVGMVTASMLLGTKKRCVSLICKSEQDRAQEVYSTSVYFALACALLITAVCIFCSGPIVHFLGATDVGSQLYHDARTYLIGLSFGAPTLILVPVMTPVVQMSGKKLPIKLSLIAIAGFDILFDILSATFQYGMFGMGLGTSIAQTIGFIILIFPTKQGSVLKLNIKKFRAHHLKGIIKEGMPKIVRRTCNLVKPITVNKLLMILVGSCGMSAMSVRNNLSNFGECVGAALGATVLILTVVFVSEQSESRLVQLKKRGILYLFLLVVPISVLLAVFSNSIAAIYIQDNELALDYAGQAIRFMAIDLIFIAIMEIITGYWQGIGLTKDLNVIALLQRLVYPLICLAACYLLFGTKGVWISFPVSTLFTIVTCGIISYVRTKKTGLFPIPESCLIAEKKKLEYVVHSVDEISEKSEEIQKFCERAGMKRRDSMFLALFFEETATVILERGYTRKEKEKTFEFSVFIFEDKAAVHFRDNCIGFKDVSKFDLFTYDPAHPESHIGTRMVMKQVKKIDWVSLFGMNNLSAEIWFSPGIA